MTADDDDLHAERSRRLLGGAAFPLYCGPYDDCNSRGMSRLDLFAGLALQGLCANPSVYRGGGVINGWTLDRAEVVRECLRLAHELLEQLEP